MKNLSCYGTLSICPAPPWGSYHYASLPRATVQDHDILACSLSHRHQ